MTDIKPETIPVTDLPDVSPSDPLEALSWLGETVEEIAEGLRARGIKGRTVHVNACPLANYLAALGFPLTSIDYMDGPSDQMVFHLNNRPVDGFSQLAKFASDFDDRQFLDLIDNG